MKTLKSMAAAAVASMAALAAAPAFALVTVSGALDTATSISDGDILTANILFDGDEVGTDPADIVFEVVAAQDLTLTGSSTINPANGFLNATLKISVDGKELVNLDESGLNGMANTFFVEAGSLISIVAGWDEITQAESDFDVRLTAETPLPAAGLVFLTGLAGAAAARRKKKALA